MGTFSGGTFRIGRNADLDNPHRAPCESAAVRPRRTHHAYARRRDEAAPQQESCDSPRAVMPPVIPGAGLRVA